MRLFLFLLVIIHGLIHLLGFLKAFKLVEVAQLTQGISKPVGAIWLLAAILFVATAILFLFEKEYWWMIAVPAIVVSQTLIILCGRDAKFGTVANIIILYPLIVSLMNALIEFSQYIVYIKTKFEKA